MDELQQLRDRHDALADPPPESIAAARSRLTAHIRQAPVRNTSWLSAARRARPAWGLGLAGMTALTLVAAIAVAGPGVDRDRPGGRPASPGLELLPLESRPVELRPVANAEDLANNAAVVAAGDSEATFKPTQWAYVKTQYAQTQGDGGEGLFGSPKRTTIHEMWRRVDDKKFAVKENGKLEVIDGSEFEVAYPWLFSLPTEPAALLARVYEQVDAEDAKRRADAFARAKVMAMRKGKTSEEATAMAEDAAPPLTAGQRNTWAFQQIAQGMRDAVLPSRLRAAMYGAMAKIPGVRYEARSTDLAKRSCVTLYRVQSGYLREEIFINPKTYEYMGYRTIAVRDHDGSNGVPLKKGQIVGWDSLLKAVIVDKPGRRR
ncbi:hypothetical protein AB0B45_01595 [Nonomuraea sp. NPDC049152]|uniref:hypothetical protein n=1 Tax=Nonomuraea sp. NPDC049152 TaxID=3154350 RepID=UPI0033DE7E08